MTRSCGGLSLDHRPTERLERVLQGVRHLGHQGNQIPSGERREQSATMDEASLFSKVHDFADSQDAPCGPAGRHLETSRLGGLHPQTGPGGTLSSLIKQDAVFKGSDCIDSDFDALSAQCLLSECFLNDH